MSRVSSTAPLPRCVAVWLGACLVAVVLLTVLQPTLAGLSTFRSPSDLAGLPYEEALVLVAGLLLSACIIWWWFVTTVAVVEAATAVRLVGCPDVVRRAVLVACGLGLATGMTPSIADTTAGSPPSHSTGPASLAGLQVPDRSPARIRMHPTQPQRQGDSTVLVVPGDSLWAIAEARLPTDATNADIDAFWRAIWQANRRVVGDDPDLIHPGTELRVPTDSEPTDRTQEQ